MKPIRTWVLIADAARARVFESTGKGTGLTIVQDMSAGCRPGAEP